MDLFFLIGKFGAADLWSVQYPILQYVLVAKLTREMLWGRSCWSLAERPPSYRSGHSALRSTAHKAAAHCSPSALLAAWRGDLAAVGRAHVVRACHCRATPERATLIPTDDAKDGLELLLRQPGPQGEPARRARRPELP